MGCKVCIFAWYLNKEVFVEQSTSFELPDSKSKAWGCKHLYVGWIGTKGLMQVNAKVEAWVQDDGSKFIALLFGSRDIWKG